MANTDVYSTTSCIRMKPKGGVGLVTRSIYEKYYLFHRIYLNYCAHIVYMLLDNQKKHIQHNIITQRNIINKFH